MANNYLYFLNLLNNIHKLLIDQILFKIYQIINIKSFVINNYS